MVGLMVDKGLSLGRKLVVSGFVVSSVPVVLPPLVMISVIGFAASVSFGFVYASYVCTKKLMSKLLPSRVIVMPNYASQVENGKEKEDKLASVKEELEDDFKPFFDVEIGSSEEATKTVDTEEQKNVVLQRGVENESEKGLITDGQNVETDERQNVETTGGNGMNGAQKREGKKKGFGKLHFSGKKETGEDEGIEKKKSSKEAKSGAKESGIETVDDHKETTKKSKDVSYVDITASRSEAAAKPAIKDGDVSKIPVRNAAK